MDAFWYLRLVNEQNSISTFSSSDSALCAFLAAAGEGNSLRKVAHFPKNRNLLPSSLFREGDA